MRRRCALWLLLMCLVLQPVWAEPPVHPVEALFSAAKQGDNAKIQALLKQGVDVNAYDKGTGYTALMLAAQMNRPKTVKLLLDEGAFVDSPNPYTGKDGTPLMLASNGWPNLISGAPAPKLVPPTSVADGKRQLDAMLRWRHGYYEVIQLLIDHGADVKVSGSDGSTPLIRASFGCDAQTLQLLLKHGADVNAKTHGRDGVETPLMSAAIVTWPDAAQKVKLLLAWGADLSTKNEKGETVLSLARQMHQKEIVKLLEAELAKRKTAIPPY